MIIKAKRGYFKGLELAFYNSLYEAMTGECIKKCFYNFYSKEYMYF